MTENAEASGIDAELSRAIFEPLNLTSLVENLLRAREERGLNAGRKVEILRETPSAKVLGVPLRLERVIDNLLDNAVSFSPTYGTITVEVGREGDAVLLTVCDAGPGISPDAREKVFARFHTARPDTEQFGDHSGLGLAIARTIAEAHDGTLSVRDRADGKPGACLALRLPAASRPSPIGPPASRSGGAACSSRATAGPASPRWHSR